MTIKKSNELLGTLGKGALAGVSLATMLKFLNMMKSRKPGGRTVDINKDFGSASAGAIPVYVDVTPDQAKEFERITGQKVGYETEEDRYIKMAQQLKLGNNYNWLAHGAVGGLGAYAGFSMFKKLINSLQKRNLNRRLDQVKADLADLYSSNASDRGLDSLPGVKKLSHLKEAMDTYFELYDNKEEINKAYLLGKDADLEKTASGLVGNLSSLAFSPAKQTGKSIFKTLLPYMAAVALITGGASYMGSRGSAGKRNELKELRRQMRSTNADPYVELRPRIRQQARALDPSPVED